MFPVGVTTVTCNATDAEDNTGTATFTVTVHDTTAPVVTPPANVTVEATSGAGAVASFSAGFGDRRSRRCVGGAVCGGPVELGFGVPRSGSPR